MPKLWLAYDEINNDYFFEEREPLWAERRVQLEVNNSLYRQVKEAEKKYEKFQAAMQRWLEEAEEGRLKRLSDGR